MLKKYMSELITFAIVAGCMRTHVVVLVLPGTCPVNTAGNTAERKKIMKTITEITTKQPAAAILRLAPYCRVSSDSEDQRHSFAAQVKYYTEYTAAHPEYELVDIYADDTAILGLKSELQ